MFSFILFSSPFLNRLHGRVVMGVGHLGHDEAMEAGGREFSLHGRVVKGVGHLGHDEAMEAGGDEFSLHGRVVKGVGHLGQVLYDMKINKYKRGFPQLALLAVQPCGINYFVKGTYIVV